MKQNYATPVLEICWIFADIVRTSGDQDKSIDGINNFTKNWIQ